MGHGASGAIRRRWMKRSSRRSGITDDQEAQAEIAASLMGLPIESVTAEVKKAGARSPLVLRRG